MRYVFLGVIFLCVSRANAQGAYGGNTLYEGSGSVRPSVYYTIPFNELWYRQPWREKIYLFPKYYDGRIVLKNNKAVPDTMKLNYNILLERVERIAGDTTVDILKKYPKARFIWIGTHKFYHTNVYGYLDIILEGQISVACRTVMDSQFEYGKGVPASISGPDMRSQAVSFTRHYWPIEQYFIVSSKYKIRRAGSLVLPKLARPIKRQLKEFVKDNDINYRRKDDVLKVVKFCNDNLGHSLNLKDSLYRFPRFKDGIATYKDGSTAAITLNYNFEKERFVTLTGGDTVTVADIDNVTVGETEFFNDNTVGVVEIIKKGAVGLVLRKQIVNDGNNKYHIRKTWYFLKEGHAIKPSEKVLNTVFPGHEAEIDKYLYTVQMDYQSKEDLLTLIDYCSKL